MLGLKLIHTSEYHSLVPSSMQISSWSAFPWIPKSSWYQSNIVVMTRLCIGSLDWKYTVYVGANTLRPRQDGRHFADDIFAGIFFNENFGILIKFSLKYVRKDPIDNNPALVQIMALRRSGDKPLSEPMMVSLLTHIYMRHSVSMS